MHFLIRFFTDKIIDFSRTVNKHRDARVLVPSAEGTAFSPGGNIKNMKEKKGIFQGGPCRHSKSLHRRYSTHFKALQLEQAKTSLYCDITIC